MTRTLSIVFEKASKLPPDLQEQLACQWEEDLESELKFDSTFSENPDKLSKLADSAVSEYKKGNTIQKGFDEL